MEPFDVPTDSPADTATPQNPRYPDAHDASEGHPASLQSWRPARDEERSTRHDGRTWGHELPRWLATLNPGRTGHEYEKALRYFFETPGVPQRVEDVSFDLLLAYRGALALRAASRDRPTSPRATRGSDQMFDPRLAAPWVAALPSPDSTAEHEMPSGETPPTFGPLAPATVNIRLTALRQFLVHCALVGLLPTLTPDRIRAALRRLSIERRRPYQVLAEPEWSAFLNAALEPARTTPNTSASTSEPSHGAERGPWGLSRAERAERRQREDAAKTATPVTEDLAPGPSATTERLPRSRAGLTGVRTAQRDHALLALALATGLRAIELVSLDVGDLVREWHESREEWWLVLPDAKTKGQRGGRTLPLAPTLVETLLAYVRSTGRRWEQASDRATPLFLSRHARRAERGSTTSAAQPKRTPKTPREMRLSTTQVRAIVDRVEAQWLAAQDGTRRGSGIAGESRSISPHALRHSTALALLEGDGTSRPPASVEHVRGWLGHFDIRTTQGYLAHLDARKTRRPFTISPTLSADASRDAARDEDGTGEA